MGTLDTPSVIFEGVFVGLDKRDTKTGKSIVNGSIVDDTNSIKFIKFTNSPEEGDALLKQLKGLQRVRVQGSVNFDDRFDKDYILSIDVYKRQVCILCLNAFDATKFKQSCPQLVNFFFIGTFITE